MNQKAKQTIGMDNWLYIASHALSMFLREGGQIEIESTDRGIRLVIPGIHIGDPGIHSELWEQTTKQKRETLS